MPFVETSALTAKNVEVCLHTLVHNILDDFSTAFVGSGSSSQVSLDFVAIAKSRESNRNRSRGSSAEKKGKKCVVS